jgi:hypothetical protein
MIRLFFAPANVEGIEALQLPEPTPEFLSTGSAIFH